MADDLERLRAAMAARLQQIGIAPDDPRVAPMLAQVQALMQQRAASVPEGVVPFMPAHAGTREDNGGQAAAVAIDALPAQLRALVQDYLNTVRASKPASLQGGGWFIPAPALSASESGCKLVELGVADRASVAVAAYTAWTSERYGGPDGAALRRIVSDLLRGKLELDEAQALQLIKAAVREGFSYSTHSPNGAVASALKRHVETRGLSAAVREALAGLRARMVHTQAALNSEGRKLVAAVDAMLAHESRGSSDEPRFTPKPDAWGKAIGAKLDAMAPDARARLTRLLASAAQGGDNAKPAKGWLKTVEKQLASGERERDGALLLDAIECHEPGVSLALENQNTLRALVWMAAIAAPAAAARRLEAYAQKCLTFSSAHFAYLSLVLGNAAVHAFSLMPGTAGVGSLSRLKRRLKRPGEIKTVEKALAALAAARGMSAGELEEIGLPDFGFGGDGTMEAAIGPAVAVLTITDTSSLETTWRGADGKALSGPPAAVKNEHADALKAFKARIKEIGETLTAQRLRLERLYLGDREWPLEVWRERYVDEPLVRNLSQRLIWSFRIGQDWVPGLLQDGAPRDVSGNPLAVESGQTRVRLWHSMQSSAPQVLAWRQRLAKLGITQPFKQAHRKVYVLTDAERATRTYSNRFAAHIVDQYRFRALCQARGWNCPAYGSWDGGDARPLKRVAERGLQIELWVDPVESSIDHESFRFQHLTTDQVRFATTAGEPIPLEQVDPVLFSELMRDVDLFVGVAGIGSDPAWPDRADDPFEGYWSRVAFGELTESGRTRHAVLADILPGLAIADRCRLEERWLVVAGKLRRYRIHLGSGNIQMEPNNQYLCIVRDRQSESAHVRLPFEGDSTLSIILSKAFMLAEDDKIRDASIRRQILQGLPGDP
jgi:Domain of unknown function (DUF4132)